MTAIVFVGPSLPLDLATAELDATYRPPAAQGDVYRAASSRPTAIGLIDGYFSQVRSVWHKEILWALDRGIPVFGSASMGALRAAELAPFGMVGVGAIYAAFASGTLEDDDEVAIVHGPAELGYPCLSEAMVNIRATIAHAAACGVADADLRDRALRRSKAAFYPDRCYAGLAATAEGPDEAALWQWMASHRIDQKRADALQMLREMRLMQDGGMRPTPVDFRLERSLALHELARAMQDDQGDEG